MVIRLLLADDQALVRGALSALLGLEPDFEVVAEASNGTDAIAAAVKHGVDIALLDIDMPAPNGIDVAAELHRRGIRSLIVTTFGRPGYVQRALDAGASGFIVKDTPPDELAAAVRRVHNGERVVDPALATESVIDGRSPLTGREADVLRAALTGQSTATIAEQLHLSAGTVRNYLSTATAKVGSQTTAQAAIVARDRGWL